MSTENKILIGFAATALAGITFGLLFAPHSGEKTRNKLRKGANSLVDAVRSNTDSIKEKASDLIDDAKSAYHQAKGEAKLEMNHAEKAINKV